MSKILVVDDDRVFRKSVVMALNSIYEVVEACNVSEAKEKIANDGFDIVITDMRMPLEDGKWIDEEGGFKVLRYVKEVSQGTLILMMTAYGNIENALRAIKQGAYDYIFKPSSPDEIGFRVKRALEQLELMDENRYYRERIRDILGKIVGESEGLKQVFSQIKKVASTKTPVLIRGETGVGKELIARAIHDRSPRANKPFIAIHLAAEPENLIESAIFGHEKGAFTGAIERRIGGFELAKEGSLFLDEIGEIPVQAQIKLLRVLESQEFRRVGGSTTIKTDARIIAATNQDMEKKIRDGTLREDFYYRLNVFSIFVPPLRKRKSDIPLLVKYFLKHTSRLISHSAINLLMGYEWPGNIRELKNLIERVAILCEGDEIDEDDIRQQLKKTEDITFQEAISKILSSYNFEGEMISIIDRIKYHLAQEMILKVGNRKEAAKKLGIGESTLYDWLKYGEQSK